MWIYVIGGIVLAFGFVVFFGAPYIPSHRRDVARVFKKLKIGPTDCVVDVGSGDGLVLREAAKRGAKAIGYEINPLMVAIAAVASLRYQSVSTKLANHWHVQLPSDTTLVYAFSVGRDRRKLTRKMQSEANRLNRTLKVLCYGNPLNDRIPELTFEAYALYSFHPLHSGKAQV